MKQNPNFILSNVAGNDVLIPIGKQSVNFNAVISLNKLGREIWEMLETDITETEIISNILSKYEVTEEKAKLDTEIFLNSLRQKECIID